MLKKNIWGTRLYIQLWMVLVLSKNRRIDCFQEKKKMLVQMLALMEIPHVHDSTLNNCAAFSKQML